MAERAVPIVFGFITEPIKKYIFSPIKTQISYAFKCGSKVEKLQDGVKQLQEKTVRLQDSVDAKTRNMEEIYPDVIESLSAANIDIEEADNLIQRKEDDMKKKCFLGFCPNLKTRYHLGKSSEKKALAIDRKGLAIESFIQNPDRIASRPPPQQALPPLVYNREGLHSRVLLLDQIMDALRDPRLNMIGVHGMGGVGKTTLAREVQGKAVAEKLFDDVIFVAVSQKPEKRSIQEEIAGFLGLTFNVEALSVRASQLNKRLEKSKVLIILDDLWQKLDLYAVGIPSGELYKGPCKIMLTSRDSDLLSGEMGAQQLFSLATLGEDETWRLFEMSVAEDCKKDPQFHAKATDIAKKCAGLPLLIQLVTAELKGKEIHVWNTMLIQLSVLRDDQKVCKVLESSYHNLPEEDIKSFFLLCAMFGQSNIRIQHLLTHSMGLGLLRQINIEASRDKVLTLIDKLKAKSLLLNGDIDGCVKMHDVIRETALSIARVQHAFIGTGLSNWPNKNCTRISFSYSDIRELPEVMDYPEAELFLLFTEDLCLEIPDSFFKGINQLKVVDLTGMRLMPLPSSIRSLTNLQTLCLHRCRLDNVAMVGKLKLLESLSFANSNIVELPREIEALTGLKLLDLRNCSDLKIIPENVLSKLGSLEELYMLNSFVRWNAKGNASLVELDSLSHLSTLEIEIVDSKLIPQSCNFFGELESYKIFIGDGDDQRSWQGGNDERSRTLKLKLDAGFQLKDGIQVLLSGTKDLYLSNERRIESVLYDLDLEGFLQLKHLHIVNDFGIQHLIRSTSCVAFPILESLYLQCLCSLETFCNGQLETGSFGELRILKISGCDKLKRLFPLSSAKCLRQLREMEVEDCGNMEAIVGQEGEDERSNNEVIEFSQLSSLKLKKLPHLKGFYKIYERSESEKLLFNEKVSFPNLTSLEVSECKSLKYVFTTSMVKCLMQLKKLDIRGCELVEEIIQSKKDEEIEQESINAIVFPNLDYLSLYNLPKVKTFNFGYSIGFPLLRKLKICHCGAMKNFVPKSSNNESDDQEEYLFNEMVTFSNLETMEVRGMYLKYLWDKQFTPHSFSKLKSLEIYSCPRLSVVFPSYACRRFSLRYVHIHSLPSLKNIWSNDPCGAFIFENLQSVQVDCCEDLKYVFPASIGSGLLQLRQLRILNCKNVEVIIAKELKDERSDHSFQFPELTMLNLFDLKEMRSLYEGGHTFYCPKLKNLQLLEASKFTVDKFIGNNLEELRIDEQGFNAIQQSNQFSVEFLYKLKKITLENLDEESSIPVVFGFFRRLKYLEILVFKLCHLEEILFESDNERPIGDQEQLHHLITLKHLELSGVWKLKHVTTKKKDSQLTNHILQHLQTLNIQSCDDLMNIEPSSASFQSLTTLCVHDCSNMTNLVTASTAKTMVQLMELKVVDCWKIEEIVTKDDGDHDTEHPADIFKKLKRLELSYLGKFNSFCSKNYPFNFPLLEQVTIKGCRRMKIFSGGDLNTPKLRGILFEDEQQWEGNLNDTISSQLREWVGGHVEGGRLFRNVESLQVVKEAICSKAILANGMQFLNKLKKVTVRDCQSVQVVFDLEGLTPEVDGHAWMLPQLNELEFINLPMLTQLCNKAAKGILDFNKLKVLQIENCGRLEYVFTWSMASCLFQLARIEVKNCEMMKTIIKEEEGKDAAQVIFGSLKSIVVECLPKFSSFYAGSCVLECPSLNKISIRGCPTIKPFISRLMSDDREGKEEHNHIHFSHKVFPKLEELSLDIKSITAILQFELPTNFFSNVKKLELGYYSATTNSYVPLLLLRFLSRLPNVAKLGVCNSSFQELFKFERLGRYMEEAATALPQIRALKLENLDCLKQIWCQNSQLLTSSFQNLTTLEVCGCNQLRNLITSSVAKSMVHLEKLRLKSCNMLVEIVEHINDGKSDQEIVFPKMKTLELDDLQSLRTFSSGHCTFKFPCLEEVSVKKCPNLRVFCPGNTSTPMLNGVKQYPHSWIDSYWEANLNTTMEQIYKKMVGFKGLKDVKLSLFPILKDNWGCQFPFENFGGLKRLVVDDCAVISNAISSHLLQHLKKLKVLIVEKCHLVEQVFDCQGLNDIRYGTRRMNYLKELHLIDLPKLTYVWSKDPQQILSFKNLQLLKVHNCGRLTFIFDLSTASSLPNLQHLEVKNCRLLEHIVAEGDDEKMQEHQTIFPSLQSMNLQHLTNLLSFYSANGFLECSTLKMIEVVECPNMELFSSISSNGQNSCMITEEKEESISNEITFLGNKIPIPGLEELKVEWNSLKGILYGDGQMEFLHRLKCIELTGFQGEENAILPSNFLQHFPKLEKLALSDSSIEEVNLQEVSFLKSEDAEAVALLSKLKLSNLPKLKHLVHNDSQLVPLFQNLEALEIVECSRLEILVPSTVSFQNLTNLEMLKCDGMINLMTASTARSLVQLKRMNVKDCKMMQEIVATASEGVEYEIRFSQLEYLGLDDIPCLTSFSSGNFDFHFPSLKEVLVTRCPNMKLFAEQIPTAPKLWKVRTGTHEYDWEWEGSLNTTIQALFLGKDAEGTNT